MLHRTCNLANQLAYYEEKGLPKPNSVVMACQDLGTDISVWPSNGGQIHTLQKGTQGVMSEITSCQTRAFHGALCLFYGRFVFQRVFMSGHETFMDVETTVLDTYQEMAAAEDFKDAHYGLEGKRTAPMSWPAFVASCEARTVGARNLWTDWWSRRVAGYCVGNFSRQWSIVQEVWEIIDSNPKITNWREALRVLGKPVLPI